MSLHTYIRTYILQQEQFFTLGGKIVTVEVGLSRGKSYRGGGSFVTGVDLSRYTGMEVS